MYFSDHYRERWSRCLSFKIEINPGTVSDKIIFVKFQVSFQKDLLKYVCKTEEFKNLKKQNQPVVSAFSSNKVS